MDQWKPLTHASIMGIEGIWSTVESAFKPQARLHISLSPCVCYRYTTESSVTALTLGTFLFMQKLKMGFPTLNEGKIQQ